MLARLLRFLPPERAHALALGALAQRLPRVRIDTDPRIVASLFGRSLPHPIGLAAGFDKDAVAVPGLFGLGFSFVEIGTLTPRPQPGNPSPRLFRLERDRALINRMGFNNRGHEAALARLARLPDLPGLLGVNLGINKDATDPSEDYLAGLRRFAEIADYLVINVSSPNTPGLRDLQEMGPLRALTTALVAARAEAAGTVPLLLKLAPDLAPADACAIADLALEQGLDGLILTNTTTGQRGHLQAPARSEVGGLSGRPLFDPSTSMLRTIFRHTEGRLPLIGVGGIDTAEAAYAKLRAGASVLELYTALIYEGPFLIRRLVRELSRLLERDGVAAIAEIRGVDA
jgi:dihydroorotate dehydrogenase